MAPTKQGGAMGYLQHVFQPGIDTLTHMGDHFIQKIIVSGLMVIVMAFVQDNLIPLVILIFFTVVDWLAGIAAALKSRQFTSSKFRHTAVKIFAYTLIIVMLHLLGELSALVGKLNLDLGATLYFAATEVLSIGENVTLISGVSIPGWIAVLINKILKKGDKNPLTLRPLFPTFPGGPIPQGTAPDPSLRFLATGNFTLTNRKDEPNEA